MPARPGPPFDNVPVPDPTKLTTDAVNALERKLRELYDLRFEQLDLRLQQRFEAQSKALDAALASADLKAAALSDKIDRNAVRLEHLITREEYAVQHKALGDRVETVALDLKENITRAEYSSQHKALIDKIDDLRARYYEASGLAAGSNVVQQLRDLSAEITDLRQSRDMSSGGSAGVTRLVGWGVAAITTVISLILLAVNISRGG